MTGSTDPALRALWVPEYETQLVEYVGPQWPTVIVEKWERNQLGERRFVESRSAALAAAEAAPLDVERLARRLIDNPKNWPPLTMGAEDFVALRAALDALRSPDTETACPGCGKAGVPFNDQRGGRHVPSIHRASPDTETAGEAG